MNELQQILDWMKANENADNKAGMAHFGIETAHAYGLSIKQLEPLARLHRKNHELAQQLWATGIHEARLLACLIDDPKQVTEAQMESWAQDFDSWDVVDQCCNKLFDKTPYAYGKAVEWSAHLLIFVKRAGFVLMAMLAVHDKKAADEPFIHFLSLIEREAIDERNFVKKATNWALRQIGKRNLSLNAAAIATARRIHQLDSKAARWVASDALRELTSESAQYRLRTPISERLKKK
jgi:3-methyladenine DNA glycosylase AlkD